VIGAWLPPARWAATQSATALLVVRLLLVANTLVLVVAGGLCLVAVEGPAGIVGTALIWSLAALLLCVVPYTNPRRGERSRW
jgi:hypothetical protein